MAIANGYFDCLRIAKSKSSKRNKKNILLFVRIPTVNIERHAWSFSLCISTVTRIGNVSCRVWCAAFVFFFVFNECIILFGHDSFFTHSAKFISAACAQSWIRPIYGKIYGNLQNVTTTAKNNNKFIVNAMANTVYNGRQTEKKNNKKTMKTTALRERKKNV